MPELTILAQCKTNLKGHSCSSSPGASVEAVRGCASQLSFSFWLLSLPSPSYRFWYPGDSLVSILLAKFQLRAYLLGNPTHDNNWIIPLSAEISRTVNPAFYMPQIVFQKWRKIKIFSGGRTLRMCMLCYKKDWRNSSSGRWITPDNNLGARGRMKSTGSSKYLDEYKGRYTVSSLFFRFYF